MLFSPRVMLSMAILLLCILSITASAHQPKHQPASKGVQSPSKGANPANKPMLPAMPGSKGKGSHISRRSKKRRGSSHQPVPHKKPRRSDSKDRASKSKDRAPKSNPVKHPKPSKSRVSHGGKPAPALTPSPAPATHNGDETDSTERHSKPEPHGDNTNPTPSQDRDHDGSTPESHVIPPSRTHPSPLPSSSTQPGSITIENPPTQAQPSPSTQTFIPSPLNSSLGGDNSADHPSQSELNDIDPPPYTELVPDDSTDHHTPNPYPYPFPNPNTPKSPNPKHPIPPAVVEDEDPQAVLRRLAGKLDRGLPEGWEALFQTPETRGSTGLEVIHPSDLNTTIQTWSLDGQLHQTVLQDLDTLIHTAIGDGVYVARGLSYTSPTCRERFRPLCLSTLIVATRVQYAEGHKAWRAEIAHVYMHSTAERSKHEQHIDPTTNRTVFVAIDSIVNAVKDVTERSRKLTRQERQNAESMLSTFQSDWALDHLPELNTLSITHHRSSSADTAYIRDTGSLENLLGLFIGNTRGNRDDFNSQKLALLKNIQEATQTRDQALNNKQVIVKEDKVAESLEHSHLLSSCFKRAGIEGSIQEWWDRISPDLRGFPISVECESAAQTVMAAQAPPEKCSAAHDLTAVTRYAWAMIVPHGSSSLNVMLLENTVNTTFVDCNERPKSDHDDDKSDHDDDKDGKEPTEDPLGATVRWSVVQPNGSFYPVQYLAHWTLVPKLVHKEILGLLRFQTASAFMNVLMPAFSMPQEPLLPLNPPETIHNDEGDEKSQHQNEGHK